jgi:hypothetical protein
MLCELASLWGSRKSGGRGSTSVEPQAFRACDRGGRAHAIPKLPAIPNHASLRLAGSGASKPTPEPLAPRVCELACEPGGREATTRGTPSYSRLQVQGCGVGLRGRLCAGVQLCMFRARHVLVLLLWMGYARRVSAEHWLPTSGSNHRKVSPRPYFARLRRAQVSFQELVECFVHDSLLLSTLETPKTHFFRASLS